MKPATKFANVLVRTQDFKTAGVLSLPKALMLVLASGPNLVQLKLVR